MNGVIVYETIWLIAVGLIKTSEITDVVCSDVVSPVTGLLFVATQVKFTPATFETNERLTALPLQIVNALLLVTMGKGLTVTAIVKGWPWQPPTLGVTV